MARRWAIAVALCLAAAVGVAAQAVAPAAGTINLSTALNLGSFNAATDTPVEFIFGLDAAIAEANSAGGVHGRPVALHLPDRTIASIPHRVGAFDAGLAASAALIHNDFAWPLGGPVAQGMPIIAPLTIDQRFFYGEGGTDATAPYAAQTVNLRPSWQAETVQLIHFGINRLFCYRFLAAYSVLVAPETLANIQVALKKSDLPAATEIAMSLNATASIPALLQYLGGVAAANPLGLPQCIVLLVTPIEAAAVMQAVYGTGLRDRFWFLATSLTRRKVFTAPGVGAAPFTRLFTTSTAPHHSDTRHVVIRRYQAAIAVVQNAVPAYRAGVNYTGLGDDFRSLDGYLAGRLTLAVLGFMQPGNYSGAAFRATARIVRSFALDDFVLGPYTGPCEGQATSLTGACPCNTGPRRIFTNGVDPSTGRSVNIDDDTARSERNVAVAVVPWSKAELEPSTLRAVRHMVTFVDASLSPRMQRIARAFQDAWVRRQYAQRDANAALILPVPIDTATAPTRTDVLISFARFNVRGFIGVPGGITAGIPVLKAGAAITTWPEADPAVRYVKQWDSSDFAIYPVLADFLHTAAAYAQSLRLDYHDLHLIADTARLAELMAMSAETFGFSEVEHSTVVSAAQAADLTLPTRGLVVVASQEPAVLQRVMALAASVPATKVLLVSSEFVLQQELDHGAGYARIPENVLFATGMPHYYSAHNASEAYALFMTAVIVDVTERVLRANATTVAEFLNVVYSLGAVATNYGSVTPLSIDPCTTIPVNGSVWPHPGQACQCNKGLNRFHIRKLQDWADNTTAVLFTLQHRACGVEFSKMAATSALSTGTIIAIAAAGFGFVLVSALAGVALVCVMRGNARDNRNAPKDASKPFSIVFTDIQASTTLWASAPEHMGDAVEAHHSVIRAEVARRKGYEVKTIGDAFMVAFADAKQALDFTLDVQRALYDYDWSDCGGQLIDDTYLELCGMNTVDGEPSLGSPGTPPLGREESSASLIPLERLGASQSRTSPALKKSKSRYFQPWNGLRVRIGVHHGMGNVQYDETTKGYDYYGTVVNTAARVEAVGHGGQVLATKAAMDAYQEANGGQQFVSSIAAVQPLGPQPLRGLEDPVVLFQLLPPQLTGRGPFPGLRLEKGVSLDLEEYTTDEKTQELSEGIPQDHSAELATAPSGLTNTAGIGRRQSQSLLTLDGVLGELCRRYHARSSVAAAALVYRVLDSLLSTSAPRQRKATLKSIAERWRVPKHPPKWMKPYLASTSDKCACVSATSGRSGCSGGGGAAGGPGARAPIEDPEQHYLVIGTSVLVLRMLETTGAVPAVLAGPALGRDESTTNSSMTGRLAVSPAMVARPLSSRPAMSSSTWSRSEPSVTVHPASSGPGPDHAGLPVPQDAAPNTPAQAHVLSATLAPPLLHSPPDECQPLEP